MENSPRFWDVLERRRSIRKFKNQPVSPEIIEKMLMAAVRAPNAHNRQSWRFAVLTNSVDIERLAVRMSEDYRQTLLASGLSPQEIEVRTEGRKARICGTPLVIVLFVDTANLDNYGDQNRQSGENLMAVQSAALAGGHLLLAAEALGLGGLWMCAPLFAPQRVIEALDLPQTWLAQGMFLLGKPDEAPPYRERKPLEEVVRYI
jgi:F420 biosynthesis protein FbiB-like protein